MKMEQKFKLIEPKPDANLVKWVEVLDNSQTIPDINSPKISFNKSQDSKCEIISTPTSIKKSKSSVYFKDDFDTPPNKILKRKSKSNHKISTPRSNLDSQNVTPKVIFSPGLVRDTKDWRINPSKSSQPVPNSASITYRSVISSLESARFLFKPEITQNANVNNWVTVDSLKNNLENDCRIPPSFSARTETYSVLDEEEMSETILQLQDLSNMSKKVGESRNEIEKLKTELQTLINTNLKNKNINSQHYSATNNAENKHRSNIKVTSVTKQNIKSPKSARSLSLNKVRQASPSSKETKEDPTVDESKPKAKYYDPESTREFIKIQKLRRKEKLHQEELKKKEIEEFKKQKLQQLRQKTTQLVKENLQKSISKRKDKFTSKSNTHIVSKSNSSVNLPRCNKLRARSFDRESFRIRNTKENDNKKEETRQRSRSVSRELKLCDKGPQPQAKNSLPQRNQIPKQTKSKSDLEVVAEINHNSDKNRIAAAKKIQAAYRGYQERNKINIPNKINSNNIFSNVATENATENKFNSTLNELEDSAIPNQANLEDIKNIPENKTSAQQLIEINEINNKNDSVSSEDALKEIESIKQKLETSISQTKLENRNNETPSWLLPPSTLPYPYNFISAVKKKLEIATKSYIGKETSNKKNTSIQTEDEKKASNKKNTSIQTEDEKGKSNVSIQCSIDTIREIRELGIPEILPPKPEEIKTFMSHRCRKQLVYDESPPKLKSPTNFKEIQKKITSHSDKKEFTKSKSKGATTEDSDSDTTKNIPEISEEEQYFKHSIKSNPEHVKNHTFSRSQSEIKEHNFSSDKSKKPSVKSGKSNSIVSDLSLTKPDYKIDTSKISKHSNRSKYPSDIDSILSQYSKMRTSSKSNLLNDSHDSQYSEDFISSRSKQESDIQTESEMKQNISASKSLKSVILESLAQYNSSSFASKQISKSLTEKIINSTDNESSNDSSHHTRKSDSSKSPSKSESKREKSRNSISKKDTDFKAKEFSKADNFPSNIETKSLINQISNLEKNLYSSNESQIKTNISDNLIHSKKEDSVATTIPDSSILKTDTAQESNILSTIEESLKMDEPSIDFLKPNNNAKTETVEKKENLKSISKSSSFQDLTRPSVNLKVEKEKFFRETKSLLDINDPVRTTRVNFSRGCGNPDQIESLSALEPSVCSQDLNNISQLSESVASETALSLLDSKMNHSQLSERNCSRQDSVIMKNPYAGVSLGMFDQMIRDEDNRLEHLKAILKLRDKALFDRTKGELAWLEIQKKQLRENGKLNDVTIIKKKQRGLIIKLEQERHEMQRLKQAHKQAAKQRKNALREQKNIIKQQLSSTDQIPTKIRRLSHIERRQSGPVRVYRVESRTEEVRETTMSKNSSGTDETISVTSSVVTQISEKVSVDHSDQVDTSLALKPYPVSSKSKEKPLEDLTKALLMKEADLENRRKEAEKLLKWHERLNREEAQVVELEKKAKKSIQLDDHEKIRVLTGEQLNKMWKGITGTTEKKFNEQKKYQMSKRSLDKFFQNARKIFKEISEERSRSKRSSEDSYTSDFDASHSKLNSSIMTQINETSTSPNKMLSEKLRRITGSSRIDFITKDDSNTSDYISEKSPLSKDSIISINQQNNSNMQIETDNSPNQSIVSELDLIFDEVSVTSKKSLQDEIKSISNEEENKLSIVFEKSVEDSSTDSDLPELIISDLNNKSENTIPEVTEKSTPIQYVNNKTRENSETEIKSIYDNNNKSIISNYSHAYKISEKSDISDLIKTDPKTLPDDASQIITESNILKSRISSESKEKIENSSSTPQENLEDTDLKLSIPTESSISVDLEQTTPESSPKTKKSEENTSNIVDDNILIHSISPVVDDIEVKSENASIRNEKSIVIDLNLDVSLSKEIETEKEENLSESKVSTSKNEFSIQTKSLVEESLTKINLESEPMELSIKTDKNSLQQSDVSNENSIIESLKRSVENGATSDITSDVNVSEKSNDQKILETAEISERSNNSILKSNENKSTNEIHESKSNNSILKSHETEPIEETPKSDSKQIDSILESPKSEITEDFEQPKSELINSISKSHEIELIEKIQELESILESPKSELTEDIKKSSELEINNEEQFSEPQIKTESISIDKKVHKSETEVENIPSNESEQYQTDWENKYETDFTSDTQTQNEMNDETDLSIQENIKSSESSLQTEKDATKEGSSEKESATILESPNSLPNKESQDFSWEPQICTELEENSQEDKNVSGISHIDVRKRVSEILADSSSPRSDKSPRLQDLYVTTYGITTNSPESSPETGSPTNDDNKPDKLSSKVESQPYKNEAEELLRKQLEIEQEIIQLERQAQQQNLPYLFMREIPNKPPPPYKPPNASKSVINSIIPAKAELITKIVGQATESLYQAYISGNLKDVTYKDEKINSQKFVFDLCKEIALETCKPVENTRIPSWKCQKNEFVALISHKPVNKEELFNVINKKVLQLLNFEPVVRKDNLIIRWSRKKRDHVDEILVLESQTEEAEWTNYDMDEQTIKDNLTSDILDMLIIETAQEIRAILKKNKNMSWINYC